MSTANVRERPPRSHHLVAVSSGLPAGRKNALLRTSSIRTSKRQLQMQSGTVRRAYKSWSGLVWFLRLSVNLIHQYERLPVRQKRLLHLVHDVGKRNPVF